MAGLFIYGNLFIMNQNSMTKYMIIFLWMVSFSWSYGQKSINNTYPINFFDKTNYAELFDGSIRITKISKNDTISHGSGFFFSFTLDSINKVFVPAIVTNLHVVKDAKKIILLFRKKDRKSNIFSKFKYEILNPDSLIIPHPDKNIDLCIIRIHEILEKLYSNQRIPDFRSYQAADVYEGVNYKGIQDIFLIGYPRAFIDTSNFSPVIRKVNNATDLSLDYNSRKEFLINSPSLPGSSGSALTLFKISDQYLSTNFEMSFGPRRFSLVGILTESRTYLEPSSIRFKKGYSPSNSDSLFINNIDILSLSFSVDIGIAIKAIMVLDFTPLIRSLYVAKK